MASMVTAWRRQACRRFADCRNLRRRRGRDYAEGLPTASARRISTTRRDRKLHEAVSLISKAVIARLEGRDPSIPVPRILHQARRYWITRSSRVTRSEAWSRLALP